MKQEQKYNEQQSAYSESNYLQELVESSPKSFGFSKASTMTDFHVLYSEDRGNSSRLQCTFNFTDSQTENFSFEIWGSAEAEDFSQFCEKFLREYYKLQLRYDGQYPVVKQSPHKDI
jgi:hypothetical protein